MTPKELIDVLKTFPENEDVNISLVKWLEFTHKCKPKESGYYIVTVWESRGKYRTEIAEWNETDDAFISLKGERYNNVTSWARLPGPYSKG